ncbi:hypothetical protein CJD36_022400 [Flavipsychrobacter stenotrophus]|uniref:Transporter n=1 Tax=Flavipsychrobacter stenotrophus TaxID=2077091 RepID=A0A2S7SQA4_9BACT|nr:TolC family protein [Flavipsychrobacter stenotrophus]PQJ08807.1 hypothetical protein CJD36_022400 [Flavipsychrobacter stenotrophus]
MAKVLVAFLFILSFRDAYCQQYDLEYYVATGLSNSPLLKDYDNQILSAGIDSQLVKSVYKPQANFTSSNFYAPVINGYGYDPAVTNNGTYSSLVSVDQAFTGRKNKAAQLGTVRLQGDSLRNGKKMSEQDIRRSITNQYIIAYGDWQQLQFNEEIHKLLSQEDTLLRKLTESNIYRQTDYLTFLVTLQQQELQIRQLHLQYQTDFATLNYLCGIFDTGLVSLTPPDITVLPLPDKTSSVFYKKFMLDSMILDNNQALLNYSYRPKLGIYANAGYNTSALYQVYKTLGTGFGLNFTVPIYDGHQRKLKTQKISYLQNTVAHYKNFFNAQYDQQQAQLKQQLDNVESLITDINKQIRYAETLISVNGRLLTSGDAKIADFVIAINNYLNAKNLLAQNNISRLQVINQINYWNK